MEDQFNERKGRGGESHNESLWFFEPFFGSTSARKTNIIFFNRCMDSCERNRHIA
jgi:hypothetical protein